MVINLQFVWLPALYVCSWWLCTSLFSLLTNFAHFPVLYWPISAYYCTTIPPESCGAAGISSKVKRSTSRRVPAEYWNLNSPVFNPIHSLKIHREMKMRSSSPPSTLLQDSKFIQQHRVSPKQLKELEGKKEHKKAPYSSSGHNPGLQKPREPKLVWKHIIYTLFLKPKPSL